MEEVFSPEQVELWAEQVKNINVELTDDMSDRWSGFGDSINYTLRNTFSNALLGMETNFKDSLKRMAADLIASGLLRALGTAIGGPFGAIIGGLPGRAEGGPVSAGMS